MGIQTEYGEAQPFTLISNETGNVLTSPFEVNVYGWPLEIDAPDHAVGPLIGRGILLGAIGEDTEEDSPMPVLEIVDGDGKTETTIGLFFGIIPVEDDHVSPTTPRMTLAEYHAYLDQQ